MLIQVKRGLSANRLSTTPANGEPLFTTDTKKLYIGDGLTPGGIEVDLSGSPAPVQSVAGKVGVVSLVKADVGLTNVDNTADPNKPISTATQTALDAKATIASVTSHTSNTSNPHVVTKSQVGLSSVDDISAANLRDRSTHTGNQAIATIAGLQPSLDGKQSTLISASNIKTINSQSLLGSGDIVISSGGPGDMTKVVYDITNNGIVDNSELLQGQNSAYHLNRVNHTGTQAESTVTNLITDLASKEPIVTAGTTAQYYRGDKTMQTLDKAAVGLANVDNTSDVNKPVSTAQATSIATKKTDSMLTNKLLGRGTAATGVIEEITLGTNLSLTGTTLNATAGGGSVPTGTGFTHITTGVQDAAAKLVDTADINNSQITLPKMADVATSSVFYRKTAATGAPEVQTLATLKTDLGLTGSNSGDQTITLTGDVGGTGAGSFATTIAAATVTNTKLANVVTATIKGRTTAGTGSPEDLTPAQAKAVLAIASSDVSGLGTLATASSVNLTTQATGTLQAAQEAAHTGDVTNTAGSQSMTIANSAVTLAKMANLAPNSIIGNNTGSAATPLALTTTQTKVLLAIVESDVSGLVSDLAAKVTGNTVITAATKTKVTYDAKGLVTAGADATQDDILDGSINRSYTNTEKTKLAGIASGATANSSDAALLARINHTGTQTASTVSDFNLASRAQTEAELIAGTNITITPASTGATRTLTISSAGGSGITRSISTVTTTVTLAATTSTDFVVFIGASGLVTLPTAIGNTNRYTLKNIDTTNKTISTTSAQTMDGSTTIVLTPNTSVDVVSDNANWRIV